MEPVTPLGAAAAILGLAGKAWDLGRYIHNVYQGAKTVDTRIKNLSSEVHGLASTCDLVHAGLACVLTGAASEKHGRLYDHDGTLEKGISGQVAQCESTIEELRTIAEHLWPRKKKFVDRTVRELKLQDAKEQIDDIRARIKSHTDALHTVLLVLSIKVAHMSPGQALSQLPEDLADLRDSILRIETRLEHAPAREDIVDGETPALVEYARGALRNGMTLFDESIAGSSVGVDSVVGGEQAALTNKTVAEWTLSADWIDHERQGTRSEHFTAADANAPGDSEPIPDSKGDHDCDSDDEQAEFANTAFDAGSRAFDQQDWQSAAGYFVLSKETIMKLPADRKKMETLFELQYKIASCSYHLDSTHSAEAELQGLLQLQPNSDEQRIRQCDTYHMLAEIYIRQNKLEAAKDVCNRTLKGRSRLLGKQHEARLQSIALMSRICELSGEDVHSKVYLFMIPEDQRERLAATMSAIHPSNVDRSASSAPIQTQISSAGAVEPRNGPLARDPDSAQNSPYSAAGSKERVLGTPSVQKSSGDPDLTTSPSRVSTPKLRNIDQAVYNDGNKALAQSAHERMIKLRVQGGGVVIVSVDEMEALKRRREIQQLAPVQTPPVQVAWPASARRKVRRYKAEQP
jgi:hypothetical protein